MAPISRSESRRNALSLRYGVFLVSIFLFAIFSILQVFGKLQTYDKLKDRFYYKTVTTINETSANVTNANTDGSSNESNVSEGLDQTPQLEVAWLMSFPNSGTTYTNHLIQSYTKTTTATNYGQEQDTKKDTLSIFLDSNDGPFYRYPTWSFPPKYILTKTHCGGECDDCQIPSHKKYINSTEDFQKACCTGKRISNGSKVKTVYSIDVPKRAVHLIRDPFDNIVARLHLKERNWAEHKNEKFQERVTTFNRTREGFKAYCDFRDRRSFQREFRARSLSYTVLEFAKEVPCFQEFISYTRWHNHAIRVLNTKSIPAMTLFYEEYARDWDATVKQLLDFLVLTPASGAHAEEFILGKHYDQFYDEKEKLAARNLMKELASDEFWDLLQRYFP